MKKKILFTIIMIFIGYELYPQCNDQLVGSCFPTIENATFLKSIPVRIKKTKKGAPVSSLRNTFVFNRGISYKISICNASEFEGKMIIDIYNLETVVTSTLDKKTGKMTNDLTFDCERTGIYYLVSYFKDGLEGCSVAMISQLKDE